MIEAGLNTYLTTAIPTLNLYCGRLPQDATYPNVVYHLIATNVNHSLSGYIGLSDARLQFDVWGKSFGDCATLAESLRLNLDGFKGTMGSVTVGWALRLNQFSAPPESSDDGSDSYYYRIVSEYRIYFYEAIPSL